MIIIVLFSAAAFQVRLWLNFDPTERKQSSIPAGWPLPAEVTSPRPLLHHHRVTAADTHPLGCPHGLRKMIKRGEVPSQMSLQQQNSAQVPPRRPVQRVNYDKVLEGSSHRCGRHASPFNVPFQPWRLLQTGKRCQVPLRVPPPPDIEWNPKYSNPKEILHQVMNQYLSRV